MKNKQKQMIRTGIIILVLFFFMGIIYGIFSLVQYLRIKTAKIEVTLMDSLTADFLSDKKISDFITSMNGSIIEDRKIDTTKIGEQEINFDFINDDGIKVSYAYKIQVVDTVEPVIWLNNSYTIYKGNDVDIASKILCGDNEDANPNCYIEGEYDYNAPGDYPLVFKAEDKSGNIATKEFTLHVIEPSKNTNKQPQNTTSTYTEFSDVYAKYKTDKTKIGIDVSGWQKDIDFEKIKNAGVEFIFIKVGSTKGEEKEYYVDSKFEQNIKSANEHGIDVGIYFYSYANSKEQAKKDAEWVIEHIKDYEVTLPVVFDWENWSSFNDYNLSFFGLTEMANTFLDTINQAGYKGMIYSSKNYLEKIWLPTKYDTWLAHYTLNVEPTSYKGDYKYWQVCDDGHIDGIDTAVDIDIMYIE